VQGIEENSLFIALRQSGPGRTQIVDGHNKMAVLRIAKDSHFVVIGIPKQASIMSVPPAENRGGPGADGVSTPEQNAAETSDLRSASPPILRIVITSNTLFWRYVPSRGTKKRCWNMSSYIRKIKECGIYHPSKDELERAREMPLMRRTCGIHYGKICR